MEKTTSYRDLLRMADLPMLMLATILSRLASRMFILTLVLLALAQFSSPALAGWLSFSAMAPGLLFSPIAGAVLDRVGPTVAIRIDMMASTVFAGGIAVACAVGWGSPSVLVILTVGYSLAMPLGAAGTRTLLPRLIPSHAHDRANAVDTAIWAVVDIVGPLSAGLVVAWLGAEAAMSGIAVLYAGAAICFFGVRRLPGLAQAGTSLLRQTVEGIQIVAQQATLRGLAISYSLYQITWGALYVVVPVFVVEHYAIEDGSSLTGMLWAGMGLAGGVGALLAGHLRTARRERNVMAIGMIVTALAAWPVAAEFGFGGLAIGLMLAGLVSGPIDVALLTLRQRRTDPRQLGRVMSISMSLNLSGFPLGSALAGMVITSSLSATFILAGVASVIAAIATITIPSDARSAISRSSAPGG